ncbi:hypothetical protein [Alloyangia pacifica]|uniref:Type II toxin-antitoxin system PemK/MazF family toxin n=1 Tax=Alloyangia pacifica TaxID=311180 RepID=A0A1I6SEM7_9RHOB|nr:hypothetical protein [Alloyangia pacifica]SDG77332.1 hypothetical protein SAMN04488245_104314 [Alloyangia pacifica]SFS75374.1 hypothetical protein SAMN04488050_104314 [Alloyangia pacifica]
MTQDHRSAATLAEWQRNIAAGDVVAFRFPSGAGTPALTKVRPSLVLSVENLAEMRSVTLAFGSSQRPKKPRRDHVIAVRGEAALGAASLHAPTYFDASRRITVSIHHAGFDVSDRAETAILGRLTGWSLAEMTRIRQRLAVERDMTRERLRSRCKTPSRHIVVQRTKNGCIAGEEVRHV